MFKTWDSALTSLNQFDGFHDVGNKKAIHNEAGCILRQQKSTHITGQGQITVRLGYSQVWSLHDIAYTVKSLI